MNTAARKLPEPQAFSDQPRPNIALSPVQSSQIHAIGYDAASKTLAVQFRSGNAAIYHYPNVEPNVHASFVGADSLGAFFKDNIRGLPFEKYSAA